MDIETKSILTIILVNSAITASILFYREYKKSKGFKNKRTH